jgi:hypothetical protein
LPLTPFVMERNKKTRCRVCDTGFLFGSHQRLFWRHKRNECVGRLIAIGQAKPHMHVRSDLLLVPKDVIFHNLDVHPQFHPPPDSQSLHCFIRRLRPRAGSQEKILAKRTTYQMLESQTLFPQSEKSCDSFGVRRFIDAFHAVGQ